MVFVFIRENYHPSVPPSSSVARMSDNVGPVHSQSCIALQRLQQPSAYHLAAFALRLP